MSEYHSDAPVLGYRRWKRVDPANHVPRFGLVGSWRGEPWPHEGPAVARCRAYTPVPGVCEHGPLHHDERCKCGFHAWYSLEEAKQYNVCSSYHGVVVGIVAGAGRVLFDKRYWRAEQARVVCIIDPHEYGPQWQTRGNAVVGVTHHDLTEELVAWTLGAGRRYGVPVLDHAEAIDYASKVGAWVYGVKDNDDGSIKVEGVD